MTTTHVPYWLAAIYLPNIPTRTILALLNHFQAIEKVFHASVSELEEIGMQPKQIATLQKPNWRAVERDLAWIQQPGHSLLSWECPGYPVLLREISSPPLVLYVKGSCHALLQKQLAIVGARNASIMGLENAAAFAYHLTKTGFAITSGLALGIDGASHRGALQAKGITIGVAGTGLDHCYPASHKELVEQICTQGGAVISEFPLASSPKPHHFPRRNRIISGLSLGVLVIEAALKSGSLSTVKHALDQGREVFAIPGSIHHPLARGCHFLIRQGAKLVEKADDILEELGGMSSILMQKPTECVEKLNKKEIGVLSQIGYEMTPIDMIICRSRLTAGEVSSILLILELHGYIQLVAGGYIRVTTPYQ